MLNERALTEAAKALTEEYGSLGIVSRAIVYRHPSKQEIAETAITTYLAALPELDPFDWLHDRGVVLRLGGFEGDPIYHGGHSERHLREAWLKAQRPSTPEAGDE